jgi:hypothetical protein
MENKSKAKHNIPMSKQNFHNIIEFKLLYGDIKNFLYTLHILLQILY